jgi:hypothetical protein
MSRKGSVHSEKNNEENKDLSLKLCKFVAAMRIKSDVVHALSANAIAASFHGLERSRPPLVSSQEYCLGLSCLSQNTVALRILQGAICQQSKFSA